MYILKLSFIRLFDLSEILASPWLWAAFYGYGVFCSIIIDVIVKRWIYLQRWTMLLYMFAGFIIFVLLLAQLYYIFISGMIGLIAAMLFYIGIKFATRGKWISLLSGVVLPLLLVFISVNDFTKRRDWEEIEHESKYEATFTYFNGEHKIPIKLKKGEQLLYGVDFYMGDGWGLHFENAKRKQIPMGEERGNLILFSAEEAGEYYIVVRGVNAAGKFVVNWDIISD